MSLIQKVEIGKLKSEIRVLKEDNENVRQNSVSISVVETIVEENKRLREMLASFNKSENNN